MDTVSTAEGKKLDMMLAEFFFSCNVSFATCDSQYFKKFVKALRPAYNPPTRQRLATKLLNQTHDQIEKINSELIAKMNNQGVLLVDGWQNSS